MSSNISRWLQASQAAIRHGRKIALSGRSIERNLSIAGKLGYFDIPPKAIINIRDVKKLPPEKVCVLIAGSQAQSGSAMERLASNDHRDLQITPGDKVVFSSDYIPGNESSVQTLIDSLSKMGATVVYSEITDHLHVSGHGSQHDMLLLLNLTRPRAVLPIGGTYRHMIQYSKLAKSMGYSDSQILLPEHDQTLEVTPQGAQLSSRQSIRNVMVDGLGVGDVGNAVLRDRQRLAEEGVVVAIAEVDQNDLSQLQEFDLVSRGFVFEKYSSDLLKQASDHVRGQISKKSQKIESERRLRQLVSDSLENFLFEKTRRRPMILPVIVEV